MASLLLGYQAIVNDLRCETINGQPVASASQQTLTATLQITGTPVLSVSPASISLTGNANNIPVDTIINVYINSSNNFANRGAHGSFNVSQLSRGVNVSLSGITLVAPTTYYIFIYASLATGSNVISLPITATTSSASQSIAFQSAVAYIGTNTVQVQGLPTNINSPITFAYNLFPTVNYSEVIDIPGSLTIQEFINGSRIPFPTTFQPPSNNNNYFIYA